MIELIFLFSIIYIDYETAIDINKQKFLIIFFTNKLNLRLIKIFNYVQRFNFIIRHKSKKKRIVFDALFRPMTKKPNFVFFEKKLNALTTFVQNKILNVNDANIINVFSLSLVVEISKKFQKRIKNDYQKKFI